MMTVVPAAWRARPEWRLTEHFFRAMFDFGFLSDLGAEAFTRVLIGSVGGFVAFGLLLTRVFMERYAGLWSGSSPDLYRRALLGDDLLIIGFPMLLVAFVTILVSHSLFPDERDFRILGPLPVRRLVVFRAKLAALVLFAGLFLAAAHLSLLPLMLLTSMNPWGGVNPLRRLAAWALASVSASLFAVLAITGVAGVLVLALSRSRLQALAASVRSAVLGLLVMCVPLVSHLPALGGSLSAGAPWMAVVPPAWFLGVQRVLQGDADAWLTRLGAIGLAVTAVAVVVVAVTYTVLFRHFERLMLRAGSSSPWWRRDGRVSRSRAAPAFRGVHRFTVATLGRSPLHQGVLVGLSACGVGVATSLLTSASLTITATFVAPVLMFACGVGARAALALPMEYRANWIFRMTENQATRGDQFRAVDRLVSIYVVGVPVAAAAPLWWMAFGPAAVLAATVTAAIGLVFVHLVLLDWRRIPFTCSYLPGKRFVGHSVLAGTVTCLFFTLAAAGLGRSAVANPTRGAVITVSLGLVGYWLRARRLAAWSRTPLMFEDEFPDQPLELRL